MNFADKVARVNIVVPYLDGTEIDLVDELASRGLADLASDVEFMRLFHERISRCSKCGAWHTEPDCPECDRRRWWGIE